MISRFFTTTFTVTRLTYANNKGTYGAAGSFVGHLQQATDSQVQNFQTNGVTVSHRIWCDDATDVQESDLLSDGTYTYAVRHTRTRDRGINEHLEVFVEQTRSTA